tara:strand:+ start:6228 stop:8339 length:2112 start_codon:yes stop_codon:yes gene_type:complete
MILIEEKNKYEFDDLFNCVIETENKFLNKKLNSNICFGGKGGGGAKQQDIAPTLKPYVTDVLSRAKGEFQQPYQQYPGERVVGFTPQELAAQSGIQQMAGQYGLASMAPGLTSSAAYYTPAYGYLGQTGQALGVGAGALSESGDIQRDAAREIGKDEIGKFALTGEDIQKYMDPYQQAVIDIEKQQARQDALQTAQAIGAKSAGMGGFGGSRQAILESQAASDLGKRLSDIQSLGQQRAYQQALQTATQQQQVGLGEAAAQRAREQQLGAGIAGLAGQYGQLAGGLGSLSGQYGSLGQQALGQGYRELGYLSGVGEAQRGLGQQRADVAYGDFREAREFPTQQLERYAGMAFGVPSGYLSRPQSMPSGFQQAVGGITTAAGLGRGLGFFNQGGNIGSGGLSTVYRSNAGLINPLNLEVRRKQAEQILKSGVNPDTKKPLTDTEKQNLQNAVASSESQITTGIKDITGLTDLGGNKSSLVDPELAADIQKRSLSILQKDLYDAEQRKKDLEQDKGFALAQAGLGILAADPSRGALAAVGEGAQPALQTLSGIQKEIRDLPAKEQAAELAKLTSISDLLENLGDLNLSSTYTLDVGSGSSIGDFEKIAMQLKGGDLNSEEKKTMNSVVNDARALAQRIARSSPTLSQENTAYNNLEQEIFKRYFSSLALTEKEQNLNTDLDERTVFKEPDLSFEDFQNQYGNASQ